MSSGRKTTIVEQIRPENELEFRAETMNKKIFRQDVNYVLSPSLFLLLWQIEQLAFHSSLSRSVAPLHSFWPPRSPLLEERRESSLSMQMRSFGIRRPLTLPSSKQTDRERGTQNLVVHLPSTNPAHLEQENTKRNKKKAVLTATFTRSVYPKSLTYQFLSLWKYVLWHISVLCIPYLVCLPNSPSWEATKEDLKRQRRAQARAYEAIHHRTQWIKLFSFPSLAVGIGFHCFTCGLLG